MANFMWTNRMLLAGIAQEAVMEAALFIEEAAKLACPVDTGNLRRSINTSMPTVTPSGASTSVGTNVYYAPFVEFGTRNMQAQPFMGPALEKARAVYG